MKVYVIHSYDVISDTSGMWGVYVNKDKAEAEATRLKGVYEKYHYENVEPSEEDKYATRYSEYEVEEMEAIE